MGGKAFSLQAPLLWNELPIWKRDTLSTIKIRVKTFLLTKPIVGTGAIDPEFSLSDNAIGVGFWGLPMMNWELLLQLLLWFEIVHIKCNNNNRNNNNNIEQTVWLVTLKSTGKKKKTFSLCDKNDKNHIGWWLQILFVFLTYDILLTMSLNCHALASCHNHLSH